MNFSSMEYFTVLARERSFTRAAEQLHITQQSLSAHIAGMEQELGCPLVVRRIPLELTYAGSVLLRYHTLRLSQAVLSVERPVDLHDDCRENPQQKELKSLYCYCGYSPFRCFVPTSPNCSVICSAALRRSRRRRRS